MCQEREKNTIGKRQRTPDGTKRLHQQRSTTWDYTWNQVDATNLGSSTSNSMPTNFEDVPVLNPVHTTPSTSLATDR